jgi:hypothetical protein
MMGVFHTQRPCTGDCWATAPGEKQIIATSSENVILIGEILLDVTDNCTGIVEHLSDYGE